VAQLDGAPGGKSRGGTVRIPSIRVRLAAALTLLVAVILVAVGVATYQLLRQSLLDEIQRDVARRATTFSMASPRPPYDLDIFGAPDVFLQVADADGAVAARSGNLGERVLPLPAAARRGQVVEVRVAGRPPFLTAARWTPAGMSWSPAHRSPPTARCARCGSCSAWWWAERS
jgi:hypothetical protein